jgi:DNA-3-methyladenine glycosylase
MPRKRTIRRLGRRALNRPTLRVARELLGKFIVRRWRGRRLSAMIAETEAYKGPKDLASHAAGGRRTPRVEPLYGEGGTVYVYFVYGMHWLLNFSTAGEGRPEGVLIRGIVTGGGELLAGPGRVTRYLRIGKALDGADVTRSSEIRLEDRGVHVPASRIRRGPRVGVDSAGPYWAARPWRFRMDAAPMPRGKPAKRRRK